MKKHLIIFFFIFTVLLFSKAYAQVNVFPYVCGFETGVDNTVIVGNEVNWDGSDKWYYDDYNKNIGLFSAKSNITTTTDNSRNLFVKLNFSGKTEIKPSFYYESTNSHILIQVVGQVDGSNWEVLKDWFAPDSGTWTEVNYSELSNLDVFNDQASSKFGIRAKKTVSGSATLRLDDFQIVVDNTNLWKLNASSNDWNTSSNWYISTVPTSTIDIAIPYVNSMIPVIKTADASCKNIYILPNGNLTINSGGTLNVNGDLTIQSNSSGNGSFINKGTLTIANKGTVKVERYIAGYTTSDNGWHLLSSPVNNFTISGSDFAPENSDDFYRWDEVNNYWENWKPGNVFSTFENGKGYLVAYQTTATKNFSGDLNNANVGISGLTYTENTSHTGWHLLGNPFPCALKWNHTTGEWNLSNIDAVAKIWNESSASYTDISQDGIIPAMQGFMVHVTETGTGSLTVPIADRTHSTQNWYKNAENNKIKLTAFDTEGNTAQESIIKFNENATSGFDKEYDSHFLAGYAPLFYSVSDDVKLSTNTLPEINDDLIIPFDFVKNSSSHFYIKAEGINTLIQSKTVFLTDLKTNYTQNLNENPVYSFVSSEGDNLQRFSIHFKSSNGINEIDNNDISIYSYNNDIYVSSNKGKNIKGIISVYNLLGQQMMRKDLGNSKLNKINLKVKAGCYIVRVSTDKNAYTKKVLIR